MTTDPRAPDPRTPLILVLGRDTCEDTTRSREHLTAQGIEFTYLHVDLDPDADAWIRRLNGGEWKTPTILIGDPEQPSHTLREPTNEELDAAIGEALGL
jgi:glutaredoxin